MNDPTAWNNTQKPVKKVYLPLDKIDSRLKDTDLVLSLGPGQAGIGISIPWDKMLGLQDGQTINPNTKKQLYDLLKGNGMDEKTREGIIQETGFLKGFIQNQKSSDDKLGHSGKLIREHLGIPY